MLDVYTPYVFIASWTKCHVVTYLSARTVDFAHVYGAVAMVLFIISIVSGLVLALSFSSGPNSWLSVNENMDWGYSVLLRTIHAGNPVTAFTIMYIHIARSLLKSVSGFQSITHSTGVILLILGYAVAFLGYSMVYGDMGYWATTVIFSLFEFVPGMLDTLYGDFTLGYTAITKLFTLHYLLGLLFFVIIFVHLLVLHNVGSLHIPGTRKTVSFLDTLAKDSAVIMIALVLNVIVLLTAVFYIVHGENDTYPINFGATPAHIVPEAYLLSVYGGLKSITIKAAGIVAAAVLLFLIVQN